MTTPSIAAVVPTAAVHAVIVAVLTTKASVFSLPCLTLADWEMVLAAVAVEAVKVTDTD